MIYSYCCSRCHCCCYFECVLFLFLFFVFLSFFFVRRGRGLLWQPLPFVCLLAARIYWSNLSLSISISLFLFVSFFLCFFLSFVSISSWFWRWRIWQHVPWDTRKVEEEKKLAVVRISSSKLLVFFVVVFFEIWVRIFIFMFLFGFLWPLFRLNRRAVSNIFRLASRVDWFDPSRVSSCGTSCHISAAINQSFLSLIKLSNPIRTFSRVEIEVLITCWFSANLPQLFRLVDSFYSIESHMIQFALGWLWNRCAASSVLSFCSLWLMCIFL